MDVVRANSRSLIVKRIAYQAIRSCTERLGIADLVTLPPADDGSAWIELGDEVRLVPNSYGERCARVVVTPPFVQVDLEQLPLLVRPGQIDELFARIQIDGPWQADLDMGEWIANNIDALGMPRRKIRRPRNRTHRRITAKTGWT